MADGMKTPMETLEVLVKRYEECRDAIGKVMIGDREATGAATHAACEAREEMLKFIEADPEAAWLLISDLRWRMHQGGVR